MNFFIKKNNSAVPFFLEEPIFFFLFRRSIFVWRHNFFSEPENHVSVMFLSLKKKIRFLARRIFAGNQFLEKKVSLLRSLHFRGESKFF